METNNMLESFNCTWNLLSGYSPNVKQRVKLVVEAFATMPETDYLKMLAHDLQQASAL